MHPTLVDIENEFAEIELEVERLANRLARMETESLAPLSQEEWEATLVCASATEKIYTGCERVMARFTAEVDQAPVIHSQGWHSALLRRMANPFPGIRPAVISRETHASLDALRAFRHRERNSYGGNLDLSIVAERGHEAIAGFNALRDDVRAFFVRDQTDNDGPEKG